MREKRGPPNLDLGKEEEGKRSREFGYEETTASIFSPPTESDFSLMNGLD